MRKFKFVGDPDDYEWDINPEAGKIYAEAESFNNFSSLGFAIDTARAYKLDEYQSKFLADWEEVSEGAEAPAPGPLDGVYYRYKGKARPDFIPGALYPAFITSHATPDTFDKWHLIGYHIGRWPNNWERVTITGGAVTIEPC